MNTSALDVQKLRKDFPQLADANYHYLDSAATSLTPSVVLDALNEYYTSYRANVHRGIFAEAHRATEAYEETRKKIAVFIGADAREIIFTGGATESSNMLARMLDESLDWNTRKIIVTSVMEHHAGLVPLQQLAKRQHCLLTHIPLATDGVHLDYTKLNELITRDTAIVSVMLASNVTGVINDISRISARAHEVGALMIVDATAAMGHIPVDVHTLGADVVYFSAHKMLGPTGVGVLWAKHELLEQLAPSSFGGHMIAHSTKHESEWAPIPERFEAGTKNIGGVIAFGSAIDYLHTIGITALHGYVSELVAYAISELEKIPDVRVVAERAPKKNVGDLSFSASWGHPHDIAEILGRDRIAVRPGHHCALPYHTELGIDATVRASVYFYNTKEDIDALVGAVKKAYEIFK